MKNRRSAVNQFVTNGKQWSRPRASLLLLAAVFLVCGLFVLRAAPTLVRAALQPFQSAAPKTVAPSASIAEQRVRLAAKESQRSAPGGGNPNVTAFGVTASGALFRFQTNTPGTVTTIGNLGIMPEAIDFRPGSGQLYAIDVGPMTTQLYTVNTSNAAITPVGDGFPSEVINGAGSYSLLESTIGFDFNPRTLQADGSLRIRVVASNGTNLRINSMTGEIAAVDTDLQYAEGDPNVEAFPAVDGVAYINTAVATDAAGGTTTLYDMDFGTDDLATQNPPNSGTLNTVGSFGIGVDALDGIGFDIFSTTTTDDTNADDFGYAVFRRPIVGDRKQSPDGETGPYLLYDVNLNTGAVTNGRIIGGGLDFTGGFAVQPQVAAINIVKLTNGTDNNTPPGPTVLVGSLVFFDYNVTNTGTLPLGSVTVVDDNGTPANMADDFNPTFTGGDTNTNGLLDTNETWTYSANRNATAGQYTNTATASGDSDIIINSEGASTIVTDTDVDNHFGGTPAINIVKLTNGTDNNAPPGPTVPVGSTVTFTYIVTNPGDFPMNNVVVTDDNGTPGNMADDFNPTFVTGDTNTNGILEAGEMWTYTASRIATAGQYTNIGTVRASPINNVKSQVSDTDVDNHFGANPNITISINDVSQAEGSSGAGQFTPFNFTVSLSGMSPQTITVDFQTANGTAFAAEDYLPETGTVIFNPSETMKTVTVLINAETLEIADETFFVTLSNPTNATIADGLGQGTIINDDVATPDEPFPPHAFAITNNNQLLSFNVAAPQIILSRTPITGLAFGEAVIGIDFRPANGQLYGFTGYNRLVTLNTTTGEATIIASVPGLLGDEYGLDFNPTNDRLRIVNNRDQNYSVNPDDGTATPQTPLNPADPNITGVAYSNNFAGAATTTLYAIDSVTDTLYTQNPAAGTLTPVGPLGVNTGALVGFDITPTSGIAYASLSRTLDNAAMLYALELATGEAHLIGQIGSETLAVRDIAVSTIAAPTLVGLTTGNRLVTFNSLTPEALLTTVPITGLINGEAVIAIDYRPANGLQLFGFTNYNRLVTINATSGAASVISAPTALVGNEYGFDFNPTVDRIRMVNDADDNLRLNPDTGAVAGVDAPLAYAPGDPNTGQNPAVAGAAYTNNFVGATTTTLYDIDANRDTLVTQGSLNGSPTSPNTGQLFTVGSIGFDISPLVGFDIAPGTGAAYATLQPVLGGFSRLYAINLLTGQASLIGQVGGFEAIRDVAVPPAGTFQFPVPVAPITVAENAGSIMLTVTRTGDTALTYASVSFETVDGTASAPGDFTSTTATLFFLPGETSKTFSIPITDDMTAEMAETFTVRLTRAMNGNFNGSPSTITVTINDND